MVAYNYLGPSAPKFKKPESIEDCLSQARRLVKISSGEVYGTARLSQNRYVLGPVNRGDRILVITYPDQDKYVREALTQALKEEGAEKVDFMFMHELTGEESSPVNSVEDGWREVTRLTERIGVSTLDAPIETSVRKYLDAHPEYTVVRYGSSGTGHKIQALREHGNKFRGYWVFNNWEEFFSKAWVFPLELTRAIEMRVQESLGNASAVRITDPEGTHIEYSVTPEEAKRWQLNRFNPTHLFLDPLQASVQEIAGWLPGDVPPIFHKPDGVLAGTANHWGFYPRIELYFEKGRLVEVKGGGKYGEGIREFMDRYKDVQWPGWPDKGYFWLCDSALCTSIKAFRRTSDMFNCYDPVPNIFERTRMGVFHHGFGYRRHGEESVKYVKEQNLPGFHIHVHNYFTTFEIKLQGTDHWYKIVDKGRVSAMSDPDIKAIAHKYGDPEELLKYDWVPPLPGINCEGDYLNDYAPDPLAYLKKRIKEGKII
jgi:hypothetical protein